jgi:hypothetical protein
MLWVWRVYGRSALWVYRHHNDFVIYTRYNGSVMCKLCKWLATLLHDALLKFFLDNCQPVTLVIQPQGAPMPDIEVGQTAALKVVALNKQTPPQPVPIPADTAVTVSKSDDSVTAVDPATGNFTFTAGATTGSDDLTAAGGGLTSAPYNENVVDTKPATLEIQPQ